MTALELNPAGSARSARTAGVNRVVMELEIRRLLRNRRTLIFSMAMPVAFFLLFGMSSSDAVEQAGRGNVSAFVMVSMALYGATLATTGGAAMVSIERASGWTRQLRLTPISPAGYVLVKMLTAMTLGLASVIAVYLAGIVSGKPSMPAYLWVATGAAVWLGSLVFAAFGLLIGYLLAPENVMQALSFVLVLCAFGGGLFIPLDHLSSIWRTVAQFTPLYGVSQVVHAPLGVGWHPLAAIANVAVWLLVFSSTAMWRFRSDTGRV